MVVGSYSLTVDAKGGWVAWFWLPLMLFLVGFWYYARRKLKRRPRHPEYRPEAGKKPTPGTGPGTFG